MPVRALMLSDFDAAHALYTDLVGTIPVPSGPEGRAAFARVLGHPGTTLWAAVAEDRPVAMATLHILPNMTFSARPYALVENVVTARAERGRGFGRAVMQHVIAKAWASDCYKIMLLTGQTLGARGFYEALGFTAADKFGMTLRRAPARAPVPSP